MAIEVNRIAYISSIDVNPGIKAIETKISVRPKFVPKKYRNEVLVFPMENNTTELTGMRCFVTGAYYVQRLSRKSFIIYEIVYTPGDVKKKFKQNIAMDTKRRRYYNSD